MTFARRGENFSNKKIAEHFEMFGVKFFYEDFRAGKIISRRWRLYFLR